MKIALLGNTCNNNFALMRYLRDLGADAHLLLFSNEGLGEVNPQYNPLWDTWEYEKWEKYIHRLPINNGIEPIVGRPDKLRIRISKGKLKALFSNYDCFIGSGISPGIFSRMGISLTVFYPYSTGIEWVGEAGFRKKIEKFSIESLFRRYVRWRQIDGIRNSKIRVCDTNNITLHNLKKIGKPITRLHIPQYYDVRDINKKSFNDRLIGGLLEKIKNRNFVIFSHMRHYWEHDDSIYIESDFSSINKHNEWLVYGFYDFLKKCNSSVPVLIMVEWGKDYLATKELCNSLGIDDYVIWLPLLQRRQIRSILDYCDIGVGEFTVQNGASWGSTGWEVLASGKPLLQSFNFTTKMFESLFHIPPPVGILNVQSKKDVCNHLCSMYNNKNHMITNGLLNKEWFKKYNGISLAKKWLDLLEENC
ncbi:hypothetical protein HN615_08300 [Candidatus Woesearchaeota archaeon]|nr:hypothetical protein [Candidatus Woesearchaeota archaeon]